MQWSGHRPTLRNQYATREEYKQGNTRNTSTWKWKNTRELQAWQTWLTVAQQKHSAGHSGKLESQRCHSHHYSREAREQCLPCSVGGRDFILLLPCQSWRHSPNIDVCEAVYVEEADSIFSESVTLPYDAAWASVWKKKDVFESMYLAGWMY